MPVTLDEGGAVFNIDAYSGTDDQKFAAALAAASAAGGALFIRQRSTPWSLTTSRTVPATVTLQFANSATLSLASGITLTVGGPVDAGPHHIFSGAGTVTFSQPKAFAYPEWWGVDSVSDELSIQAALNACREVRLVPGKTYVGTGASGAPRTVPSGRTLLARGATLQDIGFYHQSYDKDITFVGGTWTSTSANESGAIRYIDAPFSIFGTRIRVLDAVVTGDYWGTAVTLQNSSTDCRVDGLDWDAGNAGTDGVVVQGSGHRITNCRLKGSDDGVVLKAPLGNTENIMISNIFAEGLANVVAVGTEVGYADGQGPGPVVRNVVATNLVGKNVANAVYFKFGKDLTRYNFGTLENVRVSGVRVYDDGTYGGGTGQHRFISLVKFDAKRGANMRGIIVSDCTARVRCGAGEESNLVALLAEGIGGDLVQRDTVIEDVVIENVRGVDLYGGVDNGVGGATGEPIDRGIRVQESDARGFIRNVVFRNVAIDGCSLDAASVNAPSSSGDIVLEGFRARSAARSTTTTAYLLNLVAGRVKVSGLDLDPAGLPSVPVKIAVGVTLTGDEVVPYKITNLGATEALGAGQGAPALVAHRRTWVYRVEGVTGQAISASDTDYRTLRMDKHGGAMLFTANTSATLANRVTIASYTPVRLHASEYLSSAQSFFNPGEILKLTSSATGSRALSEMHLQLHVVRY